MVITIFRIYLPICYSPYAQLAPALVGGGKVEAERVQVSNIFPRKIRLFKIVESIIRSKRVAVNGTHESWPEEFNPQYKTPNNQRNLC